jgi:hypothetical protein
MKHLLLTITSLALTCTAGCSLVFDASKTNKRSESQNAAALSAPLLEKKEAGIEVTWEVPSDPVDGICNPNTAGRPAENLLAKRPPFSVLSLRRGEGLSSTARCIYTSCAISHHRGRYSFP